MVISDLAIVPADGEWELGAISGMLPVGVRDIGNYDKVKEMNFTKTARLALDPDADADWLFAHFQ